MAAEVPKPRHRIVFWNLENLFAPENHPGRPSWLERAIGRDLQGWTETLLSYFVMRRTGTRDITQATFTTRAGRDLVLLCNHWPSRSGGAHESRGYLMTAGETLAWFHQRIRQELGSDIPILALGDFNDEPSDESLTLHALATRERGDVERSRSVPRLYNLAWRYLQQDATDHRGDPRRCRAERESRRLQ